MALSATPEMPAYCFAVLEAHLEKRKPPAVPACVPGVECPIFVCYKTLDGNLRGCIGNFAPQNLHQQLQDYSIQSSQHDTRFNPVKASEVSGLKCTVSLLHSFEDAADWKDWHVGTHGIRISFTIGAKQYGGTYLPSVMPAQGWDRKEAIESLVRKAGHRGAVTEELLDSIKLERYQESESCVTHAESRQLLAKNS